MSSIDSAQFVWLKAKVMESPDQAIVTDWRESLESAVASNPLVPSRSQADKHTITVIIPCHNQGKYLTETIESILCQTVQPEEIIVVDDGSTDETKQVALSYPQVSYVFQEHEGNHTPARAMNNGLKHSYGDFIVCLAADDKIAPDYLEKCLNQFTNSEVGIVFSGCREFGSSNIVRTPRSPRHRFSVYREPHGQIGAMMVKRDVYFETWQSDLSSVGLYNESLHSLEDWDFYIRAGLAGWKIKSIPAPLHYARVHQGRVTAHADPSELWKNYPSMRGYTLISRGFDAIVNSITSPKQLLRNITKKVAT